MSDHHWAPLDRELPIAERIKLMADGDIQKIFNDIECIYELMSEEEYTLRWYKYWDERLC